MEALVIVVLLFGFIFLVIPRRKDVYGKIIAFKEKQISLSVTGELLLFPACFIRIQNPITHKKTTIEGIPPDLFEKIKSKQCINIVLYCEKFIFSDSCTFYSVISEE